jgi:Zn-dependent M32 family carboxypeptidase
MRCARRSGKSRHEWWRVPNHTPPTPARPFADFSTGKFNAQVAAALGFRFRRGFNDTTTHPFCTLHTSTTRRLTTRYMESDFTSSPRSPPMKRGSRALRAGLACRGLWPATGTRLCSAIHESQSRLWKPRAVRGSSEKWHPAAQEAFLNYLTSKENSPLSLASGPSSQIRVEADVSDL